MRAASLINYTSALEQIGDELRAMARRCFADTFGHLYETEAFNEFLDRTYGPEGRMERDFADRTIRWRIATTSDGPVGYAKLIPLRAPAPDPLPGAVELQQLFVLKDWQGSGVAQHLMDWVLATAAADLAPEVYLTVFDHNERAKRFYRRNGFSEVGRRTFTLGDRVDDDRIWLRPLT